MPCTASDTVPSLTAMLAASSKEPLNKRYKKLLKRKAKVISVSHLQIPIRTAL